MSKEVPVNSAHLTTWECYDFLDRHLVGRICISDDDGPLAIRVSYRIVGPESNPAVIIRTSAETALGRYSGRA